LLGPTSGAALCLKVIAVKSYKATRIASLIVAVIALGACGGGGGNPGVCQGSSLVCSSSGNANSNNSAPPSAAPASPAATGSNSSVPSGAIPSSESVANICTLSGQQQFTRSYLDETYLWYQEIPNVAPSQFTTVQDYFYASLTQARDSSGAQKDRFSFIAPAADADSLSTGANIGYGVDWVRDSANRLRITQVAAGSPSAAAGLVRGGQLVSLIAGNGDLFPNAAGASITFSYRPTLTSPERVVTLNAAPVVDDPVPQSKVFTTATGQRAGYVLFNAHTQGAQDKLIDTLSGMASAGLQTVVLDLRYNGGGFIYTALSLATMLSGPSNENRVFERLQFSDKRQQDTADSTFTYTGALQFGEARYPANFALPRLNLPRVYVLTTDNTCSASESVINGLRGVDVEVILIGQTTCGKPYGFQRKDNCGLAYYPIEFQGTNAKGFGDYASGMPATCNVADDLDRPLGSVNEGLLSAALAHIDTGSCPAAVSTSSVAFTKSARNAKDSLRDLPTVNRPRMPGKVLLPSK
jgi:carboxyl-terminal processing protease